MAEMTILIQDLSIVFVDADRPNADVSPGVLCDFSPPVSSHKIPGRRMGD